MVALSETRRPSAGRRGEGHRISPTRRRALAAALCSAGWPLGVGPRAAHRGSRARRRARSTRTRARPSTCASRDLLLARMTLEEKVAQMITLWDTKADVMPTAGSTSIRPRRARRTPTASARSPARPTGAAGRRWPRRGRHRRALARHASTIAFVNAVQRWARDQDPARHPGAVPRGSRSTATWRPTRRASRRRSGWPAASTPT